MLDEIQSATVSTRIRFGVSLAVFIAVFIAWNVYCQSSGLTGDIRFWGYLVHDLLLMALCALRFRYLRMNEAWALLGIFPLLNLGIVIFLFVKGDPAAERYSDV